MNISAPGIDTVFRLGINRWRWWLATSLALIAACTPLSLKPPIGEEIPPEPLLLALEAYRGQNQYFLRYRRGNDIFYATGDLKLRAPGVSPAVGAEFDAPQLVSMNYPAPESWKRMTRDMAKIPVLGVKEWASFRDKVFSEFLPREKNTGVSVSFDRADYFFFLDRKGRFRARRLIDKPPAYSVTRQVELMQYFEQW